MSTKQKSQRGFVAVTLITILAIALVIITYATILGTFTGGPVTVVTLHGNLLYNQDNSTTWYDTLSDVGNGTAWYVMFDTTSSGYSGTVNITWQLVSSGTNVTGAIVHTNGFSLNGGAGQEIYPSTTGNTQAGNTNWGIYTTKAGTYQIQMTVSTTT